MVLMRIREVTCSHDPHRTVVVLEDLEQRFRLAFSTDPHEAHRLAREMGHARCACNPIYDFIQSLLHTFQASMTHVVLDDTGSKGIHALVHLQLPEEKMTLSCYPPDALALALRAKVPIYATPEVLVHAEWLSRPGALTAASEEIRPWLEQVKPEDF